MKVSQKKDASNRPDAKPRHVTVAIIGAGASGLQCAHDLMSHRAEWQQSARCDGSSGTADLPESSDDLVVLEARSRVGGRIHTTPYSTKPDTITTPLPAVAEANSPSSDNTFLPFALDLGAAWMHGTGLDWKVPLTESNKHLQNPMLALLDGYSAAKSLKSTKHSKNSLDSSDVYDFLQCVVSGNPWMRPRSMLLKNDMECKIALFCAGKLLPASSRLVTKGLERHYALFREVHLLGENWFNTGRGMDTVNTSLAAALEQVEQFKVESELETPEDVQRICSVAYFFRHLVEIWYGAQAEVLPLTEFVHESEHEQDTIETETKDVYQDSSPAPPYTLHHEDDAFSPQGDYEGPHCTIRNGMASILEPLQQEGVRERIMLSQPVTSIQPMVSTRVNSDNVDGVELKTRSGTTIQADVCVVTLPVGVLQHGIAQGTLFGKLGSALSEEKIDALKRIQMGYYKKVFLEFEAIWWPRGPPFLGLVREVISGKASPTKRDSTLPPSPLGQCMLIDNIWAIRGIPCFEAILVGPAAIWAKDKSDTIIQEVVMAFMGDAMGAQVTEKAKCVNCHVTRWEEDECSLGAYSSMALGAQERHIEELRRPEWDNRLIWAGEATISEYEGSVHAALLSGKRAAKEVLAQLQQRPPSAEEDCMLRIVPVV